jgi:hypothetical protein
VNFYRFGAIKGRLAGLESGRGEKLLSEIIGATGFISHVILADVFREWEPRLQMCIDMEGDYVDGDGY